MIQIVRIICYIAVHFGLLLHQMDVSTAFLYADIQKLVFVEQPPGFKVKDKDGGELAMQLREEPLRAGPKPRELVQRHESRPCRERLCSASTRVYLYDDDGVQIHLTLYVDDLLLVSNNSDAMAMVEEKLKQRFTMTDMGAVPLVLGMEIKRDLERGTLTISKGAYSKPILERFGMSACKPTNTPRYGPELSNQQPDETLLNEVEKKRYQGIEGWLITCFPSVQVRHHVCRWPTGSRDGETQKDPHGGGEAHSSLSRRDSRLQHYVQKGRLQACSIFGLQLGQQPGHRKVHLMLLVDAVRCADWLQVGATRSDCQVDHRGGACGVGSSNEGNSVATST